MNPTQEQLNTFRDAFYPGDAFLDIGPVLKTAEDGLYYTVSLEDDFGNAVADSLDFDNEVTARRFIDWLVENASTIQVIQSREFVLVLQEVRREQLLQSIADALWGEGADSEWNSDTIQAIADAIHSQRPDLAAARA